MPSRINIGPGGGPFVELDEENGEFVIRVPEDEVNFDQSDITNVKDFTAGSVSTERSHTGGTPWHDITFYGAQSGQNVTAAFSDTLDAIDAAGGGTLFVPDGEWMLDPVTVPNHCTIRFQSTDAVVKAAPQDDSPWTLFDSQEEQASNIWFIGPGTIDGNSDAHDHPKGESPNHGDIIEPQDLTNGGVMWLTIDDAPADAIDIDVGDNLRIVGNRCFDAAGFGVHISTDSIRNYVTGNWAVSCGHELNRAGMDQRTGGEGGIYVGNVAEDCYQGFHIDGARSMWFANYAIGATHHGLELRGATQTTVSGLIVEDSGDSGVVVDGDGNELVNCRVINPNGRAFDSSTSSNTELRGCTEVGADGTTFNEDGVLVRDYSIRESTGFTGLDLPGDNSKLLGLTGENNAEASNLVDVRGDDGLARDVTSDATEEDLFRSLSRERLIVDGRSENAGDPSAVGAWSGNGARAVLKNVVVHDTDNDNLYMAHGPLGAPSWVQITP